MCSIWAICAFHVLKCAQSDNKVPLLCSFVLFGAFLCFHVLFLCSLVLFVLFCALLCSFVIFLCFFCAFLWSLVLCLCSFVLLWGFFELFCAFLCSFFLRFFKKNCKIIFFENLYLCQIRLKMHKTFTINHKIEKSFRKI